MLKIKFTGGKINSTNKAKCNKSFEIVMKLEKFSHNKNQFEVLVDCKDYKVTTVKLVSADREILDGLKKIFTKHYDIILPVYLRHPKEFEFLL